MVGAAGGTMSAQEVSFFGALFFIRSTHWRSRRPPNSHRRRQRFRDLGTDFFSAEAGYLVIWTAALNSWGTVQEKKGQILEANKDGKIVVANFSASWCGPCRMIAPLYKELSEKYPSLMFLTIDVDELMDFSSSWDIHATPTFFFLKDGQQLDKLIGANKPELEKKAPYHNMIRRFMQYYHCRTYT
ncbi:hypothetical protein OPV22_004732 [Ensete ventricosum]|uniref:Thioredoxin domain-containing protein n=1 Tax=Ensete ventricosum TaxID=4639 RepID=A0AAV8Q0P9_ENSVE|nr:hypothetical protein OPV22_004732 [Ensete ventricosum]